MNIYFTTGTYEFMTAIVEKHPHETIVKMINEDGTLLLHETEGKTIFSTPQRYEVFESIGNFPELGTVVMENVPVTEEGRPVFEYQSKAAKESAQSAAGFVALRMLRPVSSDTYVVLTVWENESSYEAWKATPTNATELERTGTDPELQIFASASYIKKYKITV